MVAALFVAALVLGWIGFDLSTRAAGQPGSFLDNLYRALDLFAFRSGAVAPPVPWQLDVARWLAPAVTAGATFGAVTALLGERLSGMRARRYSDHVVVCGLGHLGALLARNLHDAGFDVVAIERNPQNGAVGECREQGVIVFIGDATDRTLLRRARLERARHLFAVTGDDGRNAEIAIAARELVVGRSGPQLTCRVHILDDKFAGVLHQAAVGRRAGDSLRLEYFNAAELGAPALLRDHPAFDEEGRTPFGPPHLVIVGLGEMGTRLAVHAVRGWRAIPGSRGRRLRITAVDAQADARVGILHERLPRLADVCEIAAHRMDLDSAEFERADFLFGRDGTSDVTSVYVCVSDDAVGLSAALHLRHRLGGRHVPIVVRTAREGGVATLLAGEDGGDAYGGLSVFGLLDLVCRPDVLLAGQNEALARAIHEGYVRHERRPGQAGETNPSMVDWEQLPESLRESNRQQAADICRKLAAVGFDIEPLEDWDAALPTLTADEIELLARMEHDRWRREREAAGWRPAPQKSESRRESPYLVRFEDLPAEIQDIDRATARGIPAFLAEVDYAVVRLGRPGAARGGTP